MKCLILAGGSGDRLWPLSRKKYPKQFMEIHENRSLLQETVVRNLPFCEEFLIVTAASWHFILEGQMKIFQGLRYRCYLEEEARGTAAAIALVCNLQNPSELIYVVSADTWMEGSGYADSLLRAKELASQGKLVALGIPADEPRTTYGYIRHEGERVLSFEEKPDAQTAQSYLDSGEYLWNSGSFLFQAGVFLQELGKHCPALAQHCKVAVQKIRRRGAMTVFARSWMQEIPKYSVETAVFECSTNLAVVEGKFSWQDIGRLEDLENTPIHTSSPNVVLNDCSEVTVINHSSRQLVVANGLEDVIVVNTEDASYIGKKGASDALKELIGEYSEAYGSYFENNRVTYRPYGKYEVLARSAGYQVKKVTIYPGGVIGFHRHAYRSEHWSIAQGTARIAMGDPDQTKDYHCNESIFVPVGVPHMVSNPTEQLLVIIEVGIGRIVREEDIVREEYPVSDAVWKEQAEPVIRLLPAFKDYLWGGTRLREQFHKKSDLSRIAESWELSAHEAGQSVVSSGRHQGMLFGEYLQRIGREAWGWKCQALERFPILIKLLDAREDLSIQVHPDDEYALAKEHEYGKNEMWYVLDCQPGAAIYYGFSHEVCEEEICRRIEDGTLTEVLTERPVNKGDTIFVPTGTVHALKGGVLACEIQQNSNSTYRLYDYNRTDRFGNRRPLHIQQALEVLRQTTAGEEHAAIQEHFGGQWIAEEGFRKKSIGGCKYFESTCYEIETRAELSVEESSFLSLLFVEGSGTLNCKDVSEQFQAGDSFFAPAERKTILIEGHCRCIVTHV